MNSTTKNAIWFWNRDVADVLSATMKYRIMIEVLACFDRSQMQKNGFTINNLTFFTMNQILTVIALSSYANSGHLNQGSRNDHIILLRYYMSYSITRPVLWAKPSLAQ